MDLPNDEVSTALVKGCLMALDFRFSDDVVGVDLTTYNAARIWKLYGTRACKGDNLPERPHRMAQIIDKPDVLEVVKLEQLQHLAAMMPEPVQPQRQRRMVGKKSFDLEAWLAKYKLPVVSTGQWNGGQKYILNPCPWNPDHNNRAAYIIQFPDGAIAAGCHHNGCAGKKWQELRDLVEPGWRTQRRKTVVRQNAIDPLPEAILTLLSTIKDDRNPCHVFDAVEDLAQLSTSVYAKVKAELKDILGSKLNHRDLERAVQEARRQNTSSNVVLPDENALPLIPINDRPLRDLSDDALCAIIEANDPPSIFVYGGSPSRIRRDEKEHPSIETLNEHAMRGILTRVANFVSGYGDDLRQAYPPLEVVRDLQSLGTWPDIPILEGVVASPVLRPDGTVFAQPGYDPGMRLIYVPPPGFPHLSIPDHPTQEQAHAAAMFLFNELLVDFPFALDVPDDVQGSASRTHALALMLTCILRPTIEGPVPLALISAPQRGSGKTLLAEIVAHIATGQQDGAPLMVAPWSDEEWRKRITAVLTTGAPVVIIDNVANDLVAPSLAAMLTARTWQDRLLGKNDQVLILPQRAIWIATANNPIVDTDIARRSYTIRLDAQLARPWQRRDFRHADLLKWVAQNRDAVLEALLTISRAWFAAGQPATETPMLGKFEDWTRILGGVIAWAGIPHFLGNLQQLYDQTDPDTQQWEAFLMTLGKRFGDQPVTVSNVVEDILSDKNKTNSLREALPDHLADALDAGEGSFRKRLGKAFAQRADVRYGDAGIHLTRAERDTTRNVNRWRVCGYDGPTMVDETKAKVRRLQSSRNGSKTSPTTTSKVAEGEGKINSQGSPSTQASDSSETAEPKLDDESDVDLPSNRADWPEGWREAFEERAAILEIDHERERSEADQIAEDQIRKEYRQSYGPRAVLADRLAAELRLDLQALSTQLGCNLQTLSVDDAVKLQLRLMGQGEEVSAELNFDPESQLDIFLYQYARELKQMTAKRET